MSGDHPRRGLTLHNEGVDRDCTLWPCRRPLARYVVGQRINYHAVGAPVWAVGAVRPFTAAARSCRWPGVEGASANKAGTVNIQIAVAAYGYAKGFTASSARRVVLAEIMDAHRKIPWRARKVWGAGASRSVTSWMRSGFTAINTGRKTITPIRQHQHRRAVP